MQCALYLAVSFQAHNTRKKTLATRPCQHRKELTHLKPIFRLVLKLNGCTHIIKELFVGLLVKNARFVGWQQGSHPALRSIGGNDVGMALIVCPDESKNKLWLTLLEGHKERHQMTDKANWRILWKGDMHIQRRFLLLMLATLLFFVGMGWILLFPVATVSQTRWSPRKTHISENALPRMYKPEAFARAGHAQRLMNLIFNTSIILESSWSSNDGASTAGNFVRSALTALGVQHVHAVLPNAATNNIVVMGTVFASGRMAHQEAVVVAALVDTADVLPSSPSFSMHSPLVAALRIADTLSRVKWLAKNVLFVISISSDAGLRAQGLEAWVSSSFTALSACRQCAGSAPGTVALPLESHPSLIRGAIVLDWNSSLVASNAYDIGVFVPGNWGRLPDLDIVTLLLQQARLPVVITPFGSASCLSSDSYVDSLAGLLNFMANMALGPYAAHSVFLRHKYARLAWFP